ncbi:MAG: bifunctional folylpolyglutamate synthase/dihydrofolate synthase [Candidatus Cloacimonetes bacterium]|nr:bifunctional folylpolyglutamate synthase/dihydrofolate synthase [Candidatus Cloacimonadota bacterium]
MKYQEFLDYIYQRHSGNIKLGLDRIENILRAMDHPNLKLNGIHIAGTNGKGSTAAICEALSIEHGLKTGLNTSPHLIDYCERIRVNGKNINLDEIISVYKHWANIFEANEASFFEITTAMAFSVFYSKNVENAIFEVGLGGRLDGTNPFKSTVAVITSISYDHLKSLGNTIEKIAYEKAGIIKENTPVVIGRMDSVASKIIEDRAKAMNAQFFKYGRDFSVSNIKMSESSTSFDYNSKQLNLTDITVNLLGEHQAYNAALAIKAFIVFLQQINRNFNNPEIYRALNKVNWQGRMQIISRNPTIIIDGAHNEEGIKALKYNVKRIFPKKRIYFVLAILRDKKLETIIKDICEISYKVYITKNKSNRAAEIEDQVKFVRKNDLPFEVHKDVISAVMKARSDAEIESVIMVSGSLYTIAEVLREINRITNS